MPVEFGHQPGRSYTDQSGVNHPNGTAEDCSDTGQFAIVPVQTLAAAGTTQATAAQITAPTVIVSGSAGTNGVILPSNPILGQEVSVISGGGTTGVLVYPDVGGKVNGGATNASVTLAVNKGATYCCVATGPSVWWSLSN
jgi:hypothetical protein